MGSDGPDSNCAWNGPGGCDGDKKQQGRRQGKSVKAKSAKKAGNRQTAVGSGLWTVEQWLKHG